MWMSNPSRLWPASILSLGLVGCVTSSNDAGVAAEPAPPLLEGVPEAEPSGGEVANSAIAWRNSALHSGAAEAQSGLGVAEAAREAALAAAGATPPSDRPTYSASDAALVREAHEVMDGWHQAAAVGDREGYLGAFAPDAVFMGTDATERWDLATFTTYVEKHFKPGAGWTYQPSNRHVMLGESSQLAWFDEELDSAGYGALRGTGVLRRDGDAWKIVHYSMVFTVPNDVARDVVNVVRAGLPARQ